MPDPLNGTQPPFDRDDWTNRFLQQYPVHCEFRSGELRHKKLHFHEGYEIYLCLEGRGSYIVEDNLFPLHAGTLTIIAPRIVHHPFSQKDEAFSRYVLTISENYLEKLGLLCPHLEGGVDALLSGKASGSHFFLTAAQFERGRSLAEALAELLDSPHPLRELRLAHHVTDFILLLCELRENPEAGRTGVNTSFTPSSNEILIKEVVAYLTASYRDPVTIDKLLERFPVSRSQLLQLFKASTGYTITQFLIEYRLNKAKWLLAGTDLPMTEVALQSGFGDLSHFYYLFRRTNGITPKQYRQRALEPH